MLGKSRKRKQASADGPPAEPATRSLFDALPNELLVLILSMVPVRARILLASLVCRRWGQLVHRTVTSLPPIRTKTTLMSAIRANYPLTSLRLLDGSKYSLQAALRFTNLLSLTLRNPEATADAVRAGRLWSRLTYLCVEPVVPSWIPYPPEGEPVLPPIIFSSSATLTSLHLSVDHQSLIMRLFRISLPSLTELGVVLWRATDLRIFAALSQYPALRSLTVDPRDDHPGKLPLHALTRLAFLAPTYALSLDELPFKLTTSLVELELNISHMSNFIRLFQQPEFALRLVGLTVPYVKSIHLLSSTTLASLAATLTSLQNLRTLHLSAFTEAVFASVRRLASQLTALSIQLPPALLDDFLAASPQFIRLTSLRLSRIDNSTFAPFAGQFPALQEFELDFAESPAKSTVILEFLRSVIPSAPRLRCVQFAFRFDATRETALRLLSHILTEASSRGVESFALQWRHKRYLALLELLPPLPWLGVTVSTGAFQSD